MSRIGAGRSQRQRTELFGSLGRRLFCLLLAGSFLLGLVPAQIARAASVTVGCGDSAGLISAIQSANASEGSDTITLAADCTYTLTTVDNTSDGSNGQSSVWPR